jgi:hypothetical protein
MPIRTGVFTQAFQPLWDATLGKLGRRGPPAINIAAPDNARATAAGVLRISSSGAARVYKPIVVVLNDNARLCANGALRLTPSGAERVTRVPANLTFVSGGSIDFVSGGPIQGAA